METKVNILSDIEHEVEVTLSYGEIQPEIEDAYKEERKKISLPGFRKGKVPIHMLKKIYGDAIEYQASEQIATKKFWDVVDSDNLKPISTPALTEIDFKPNDKLFFKVKYEVKPTLQLKNYTDLEIEKPIFHIKEEDIEKEVDQILKSRAAFEESEKVDSKDCRITVDLQRVDENGIVIIGNKSENMVIDLSDEKVNPEIGEKALGKNKDEKFKFSFVDEHKHGEEVHKQELHYEIEIKKIEKIVFPEVTEELMQQVSNKKASTLDELKNQIRENFRKYYESQSDHIFTNSLLAKVVDNNNFDAPKGYVTNILNRLVEAEKENAKRYKTPFDENTTKENLKARAEWNAKWQIIMENISEKEGIKVLESELEELAKKEAEQTGISVEKLVKYYKDTNRDVALLEDKVIIFLKENNKVKEFDVDEKIKESKGKKK